MEQQLDFVTLVRKTCWKIVGQFLASIILAYLVPLSIISLDISVNLRPIGETILAIFFNVFSWIYICITLILIVFFNIKGMLNQIRKEMDIVYHNSLWLSPNEQSSDLKLFEFIETNRHIETMQEDIKGRIQREKEQKEEIIFKVSAMAHDLKTPLTIIKGNSELLQLEDSSKLNQQCLKDIEKASSQLDTYFNQLISYSKTFYDDKVDWRSYSLKELEQMIQQECSFLMGEEIDYSYHAEIDDEAYFSTNLDLLMRSIANIINNAREYADTEAKKIAVKLCSDQQVFIISIWNNGSAFSTETLEHFDRLFYRGDISRSSRDGHFGIGLAFVQQVVKLHNGDLHLSNSNNGAQVDLSFPLDKSEGIYPNHLD